MTPRIVAQGEEILRCRAPGSGYYRAPAEADGLYIGAEHPIVTRLELELALSTLRLMQMARAEEVEAATVEENVVPFRRERTLEEDQAAGHPEAFGGSDSPTEEA